MSHRINKFKYKTTMMQDLILFFSNWLDSEINAIITTLSDIRSPFYTWLYLWIFIKIYRTFNL